VFVLLFNGGSSHFGPECVASSHNSPSIYQHFIIVPDIKMLQ